MKWLRQIKAARRKSCYDIVYRLRTSVSGPPIHRDYYIADMKDAADEIERLREMVGHAVVNDWLARMANTGRDV